VAPRADFHLLPRDEQLHELRTLELALAARRETYRRVHGEDPTPRRRASDRDQTDHGHERREDPMAGEPMAWVRTPGGWAAGARGLGAIMLLLGVAVVASNLWSGDQTRKAIASGVEQTTREHRALKRSQDIGACINTYDFPDRRKLREEWRQGAWSTWCPWLTDDEDKSHR
jgi:hypothetical protein